MGEPQEGNQSGGEYVIVAFELQGLEEEPDEEEEAEEPTPEEAEDAEADEAAEAYQNLVYYPVDWGYSTEKEAWDSLHKLAAEGALPPGDYGVIKLCTSQDVVSISDEEESEQTP
jgi:hypothetical protein